MERTGKKEMKGKAKERKEKWGKKTPPK